MYLRSLFKKDIDTVLLKEKGIHAVLLKKILGHLIKKDIEVLLSRYRGNLTEKSIEAV